MTKETELCPTLTACDQEIQETLIMFTQNWFVHLIHLYFIIEIVLARKKALWGTKVTTEDGWGYLWNPRARGAYVGRSIGGWFTLCPTRPPPGPQPALETELRKESSLQQAQGACDLIRSFLISHRSFSYLQFFTCSSQLCEGTKAGAIFTVIFSVQ